MFEQERVIVRLQQRILREEEVLVCFLAGSHGRGSEDGYSDLDVGLLFADDISRAAAWNERRAFVGSVLPYLSAKSFDASHIRPFFHIALYSNGTKVDYRYETLDGLSPNPWDRDIRILKDKINWGERFQADSAGLSAPQPRMNAEELAALDERFWVMFWDVYRLLLRGDYEKPFTIYLELLHFSLPPLLAVLPVQDAAHQGLLHSSYGLDCEPTLRHLKQLLDAYLLARTTVVRQFALAFTAGSRVESSISELVRKTQTP